MRKVVETIGKRVATTIGAAMLALMMVGGAYALSGETTPASETPAPEASSTPTESPAPDPSPSSDDDDDGDQTKGVERVHEGCGDVEGLEGNWNHGQYVSAVGHSTGDKDAKKAAAKSDCGKPVQSVHDDDEESQSDEQENESTDDDEDEDDEDSDDDEDKPENPGKSKR